MKLLQTNSVKLTVIVLLAFFGLCAVKISAQDKDELKSKLDNLKGKIEKITVQIDGKDIVFEGKEAEKLVKRFKESGRLKRFVISTDDDDMIENEGGKNLMYKIKMDEDEAMMADKMKKKIQVEDKDGKKKVTVTTNKDGKEETKVYEGEEAEKFLKSEKELQFSQEKGDGPGERVIFMRHGSGSGCGCCCCGRGMSFRSGHSGSSGKVIKVKIIDDDDKKAEEKNEKK